METRREPTLTHCFCQMVGAVSAAAGGEHSPLKSRLNGAPPARHVCLPPAPRRRGPQKQGFRQGFKPLCFSSRPFFLPPRSSAYPTCTGPKPVQTVLNFRSRGRPLINPNPHPPSPPSTPINSRSPPLPASRLRRPQADREEGVRDSQHHVDAAHLLGRPLATVTHPTCCRLRPQRAQAAAHVGHARPGVRVHGQVHCKMGVSR